MMHEDVRKNLETEMHKLQSNVILQETVKEVMEGQLIMITEPAAAEEHRKRINKIENEISFSDKCAKIIERKLQESNKPLPSGQNDIRVI
jgi:methionyl-tRNA formyltransferase